MLKIKVSYERPDELHEVLRLLRPKILSWRRSKNQEGRFQKAYIELKS